MVSDCRGWPGIRRATRVVEQADDRAESAFESLSRARFIEAGLPLPATQITLTDLLPVIRRVDFLWPVQRVVGEADGLGKYQNPAVIADEKIRDEQLREAGYEPVHFIWKEMRYTPEVVITRIRAAFDRTRKLGYW
jgi:very-short-patch-repair endonuclease